MIMSEYEEFKESLIAKSNILMANKAMEALWQRIAYPVFLIYVLYFVL